jgi:hypothetical protein
LTNPPNIELLGFIGVGSVLLAVPFLIVAFVRRRKGRPPGERFSPRAVLTISSFLYAAFTCMFALFFTMVLQEGPFRLSPEASWSAANAVLGLYLLSRAVLARRPSNAEAWQLLTQPSLRLVRAAATSTGFFLIVNAWLLQQLGLYLMGVGFFLAVGILALLGIVRIRPPEDARAAA